LERHAVAKREKVWNGRPISSIVPAEPLDVLDGKVVPLFELIPPVHQRVYKMGLEHLGVVLGTLSMRSSTPTNLSLKDSNSRARTAHPTPSTSCSKTAPT
jgi:predicted metalloenzyme YecM